MVRKMIQWVPIDGTRWRNEFINDHENHGVGVHYGVAHGGVMAPLRELPNTSGLGGLCDRRHGGPSKIGGRLNQAAGLVRGMELRQQDRDHEPQYSNDLESLRFRRRRFK
jgi:hypothetical protein